VQDGKGQMVFLYQMTDLHRHAYYARKHPHPYLTEATETGEPFDMPFPLFWEGRTTPEKADWAALRLAVLERDHYRCVKCGNAENLHVHHIQSRRKHGANQMDNLQTLCDRCHMETTEWGRPRGTGGTQSWRAG
jgi:hypothetical protein